MKKTKKYFIYIIIGILILILCIYSLKNGFNTIKRESYVIFENNKKVNIEIAYSDKERTQGLMYREKLDYDSGMLFIFDDEKIRNFWMKNTLIPLDMIFIDSNLIIVSIANAEPCIKEPCMLYDSIYASRYVLEVNFGYAKDNGIKVGEKVKIAGI